VRKQIIVEALLQTSGRLDHLQPFVGVIKDAPPRLSESVDDVVHR